MSDCNIVSYKIKYLDSIIDIVGKAHDMLLKTLCAAKWIDEAEYSFYFANFGFLRFFFDRIICKMKKIKKKQQLIV